MDRRENETTSKKYSYQSNSPNDEVDLGLIVQKIQRGFANLGRKLTYLAGVVTRRFALIATLVLIGIGIAYFRYLSTPARYVSRMTLTSTDIRNDFCEDLIKKFNLAIGDGHYTFLSRKLQINKETAQQLAGVSYSRLDERKWLDDSLVVGQPFIVSLATYDNTVFDTLQTGIKHYLENNEYFLTLKTIRKEKLQSLIQKLDQEISQIDSLSLKTPVSVPEGLANQAGIILGQPVDPVNMFRQEIEYFNQKQDATANLVMADNFHVISGFSPRNKPDSPLLQNYLTPGGLIGFLLGLIIGVWLDKRAADKKTRPRYQEQAAV